MHDMETRPARSAGRKIRWIALAILAILLWKFSFGSIQISGDGNEYAMMAHGFVHHGTPDLRASDIADIDALPGSLVAKSNLERNVIDTIPQVLRQHAGIPLGFADGKAWGIHAIHFWMYSLLAAPFWAATAALGENLALAFSLLNFLALGLTCCRILRWYPTIGVTGAAVLAMLGPVYYLHWTGPEVMSACCVLLATLAIIRQDFALAVALAGLGATQNPPIAGLILAAGVCRGILVLRPAWAAGLTPQTRAWRDATLITAGILLAALPYAFNLAVFGVPSVIAKYYANLSFISWERFESSFIDFDQGMILGFPGLFLGLVLLPTCLAQTFRRRWLAYAAIALALTAGLVLPTLVTANWNSAHVVFIRYAYWTGMPLTAAFIVGLALLSWRRRLAILACVTLCQITAMTALGWPHSGGPPQHSPLGNWVLDHYPAFYNPDTEIFFERELHEERSPTPEDIVVHRGPDGPTKLMRYWANRAGSAGICPSGQVIQGNGLITTSGWEYVNAPFHCGTAVGTGHSAAWIVDAAHGDGAAVLGQGWSVQESTGTWTDGARSVLTVPVPAGLRPVRLALAGTYFKASTLSDVTINGIHLGRIRLGAAPIVLPTAIRDARTLTIVLAHTGLEAPDLLRTTGDRRQLGFFMHYIYLDDGVWHQALTQPDRLPRE
jgi:hypothetical protein